jgi:hypothetical protein
MMTLINYFRMIIYLLSSVTNYPEKMTELPARGSEIEGGEALAPTPKALHWLGHLQDMASFSYHPLLPRSVGKIFTTPTAIKYKNH